MCGLYAVMYVPCSNEVDELYNVEWMNLKKRQKMKLQFVVVL